MPDLTIYAYRTYTRPLFLFSDWAIYRGPQAENKISFCHTEMLLPREKLPVVRTILLEEKARVAAAINHVSRICMLCFLSNKSTDFRHGFFMTMYLYTIAITTTAVIELESMKNNKILYYRKVKMCLL